MERNKITYDPLPIPLAATKIAATPNVSQDWSFIILLFQNVDAGMYIIIIIK